MDKEIQQLYGQYEVEVLREYHEGGGSIWVHMGCPISEYICVWSTADGNVGETLHEVPLAVPAVGVTIPPEWVRN